MLDEGKKFLGLGKTAQISMEPTISEQVTSRKTVEADEATAVEEAVEELTEAIPSLSEESTHSLENLEDKLLLLN